MNENIKKLEEMLDDFTDKNNINYVYHHDNPVKRIKKTIEQIQNKGYEIPEEIINRLLLVEAFFSEDHPKLKAVWTVESHNELQAYYNSDAAEKLTEILSREFINEILIEKDLKN